MIQAEAKELADEIYQDVIGLEITNDKTQRLKIARLVAKKAQAVSKSAVWQYVINNLNDR